MHISMENCVSFSTLNSAGITTHIVYLIDRLCGLVVRVLGYISVGPGSIPGTTKKSSGSGTGFTQPREYNWGATWCRSSGSCLENREYCRRDPSRWPRGTLYLQKLAITSPTGGGRSVGIVRSRTQTVEFFYYLSYQARCRLLLSLVSFRVSGP
jgi:hypothetical protein